VFTNDSGSVGEGQDASGSATTNEFVDGDLDGQKKILLDGSAGSNCLRIPFLQGIWLASQFKSD